jgi:preprotein translocase subunit SecG
MAEDAVVGAGSFDGGDYVGGFLTKAETWAGQLATIAIALAFAWFIWGVISYTMSSDEDKKKAAKSQMIWGVIAIAVIVSIWGLVAFLQSFFGVTGNTVPSTVMPRNYIPEIN